MALLCHFLFCSVPVTLDSLHHEKNKPSAVKTTVAAVLLLAAESIPTWNKNLGFCSLYKTFSPHPLIESSPKFFRLDQCPPPYLQMRKLRFQGYEVGQTMSQGLTSRILFPNPLLFPRKPSLPGCSSELASLCILPPPTILHAESGGSSGTKDTLNWFQSQLWCQEETCSLVLKYVTLSQRTWVQVLELFLTCYVTLGEKNLWKSPYPSIQ